MSTDHSQETSQQTIEAEKLKIKHIIGLADTSSIELNEGGWDSRAYKVNGGQYYIKFPRNEKVQGRYSYQIAALKLARQATSGVQISEVVFEGPNNEYLGYTGIPGVSLKHALPSMDDLEKRAVGRLLGSFLKQFHKLSLPEARKMGPEQEITQIQDWYEKGRSLHSSVLSDSDQNKLRTLVYDMWPAELHGLGATITLCHGDFHFDNIFYDHGRIGIIDFGDVCNADHSKDFADFDDPVVFRETLTAYGSSDAMLWQKIKLREDMTRVITLTAQLIKGEREAALKTSKKIKASLPR